jgi:hypothetical protein
MAFRIQLNDHSEAVLAQMDANVERALTAMGVKAVGLIVRQMESGYTTPHKNRTHGTTSDGGTHTAIRETGDLMRDVFYEVGNSGAGTVDVGNSLEYGVFIHEGTSRLESRPYIRDALTNGAENLQQVASAYLKMGMSE